MVFRAAWVVVERLWAAASARAGQLDADLVHESVAGEWSFVQTLRHLVFATEAWLLRVILGDPSPWHPLSLPWDEAPPLDGVPHDRSARPGLSTVLALRADRMNRVSAYLDTLADADLNAMTSPVTSPGWPASESFRVGDCLLTILKEEWEHHLYAVRDLDVLTAIQAERRQRADGADL